MAIIFVESIDREEGAILDAATFRPFFLVFKSSASMVPSFIFILFCASVQDKAILDLMSHCGKGKREDPLHDLLHVDAYSLATR